MLYFAIFILIIVRFSKEEHAKIRIFFFLSLPDRAKKAGD
jgi:hypothetical protein